MNETSTFLLALKDLAPATVAVVGIAVVCFYLLQTLKTFAERHLAFMDRYIEVLDRHTGAITKITEKMQQQNTTIDKHTEVIKYVEKTLNNHKPCLSDAQKRASHS